MALTDSLVAAWELNESSGNAADSAGANTLTNTNSVTSATGKVYALARHFVRASSQSLVIADNAALSMGSGVSYTIAAWVKGTTFAGQADGGGVNRTVICKDDVGGDREWTLYYNPSISRFIAEAFASAGSGGYVPVTANNFGAASTGVWYLVIVTFDDNANTLSISVNNGSANTATQSTVFNGTAPVHIGCHAYTGLGNINHWDGDLGPIRIWKRVLTVPEKTALWHGGVGLALPFPTLELDMPCQEESDENPTINDESVFDNNGAFSNGYPSDWSTTGPGGSLTKAFSTGAEDQVQIGTQISIAADSAAFLGYFAKRASLDNADGIIDDRNNNSSGIYYEPDSNEMVVYGDGWGGTPFDPGVITTVWHYYGFLFNANGTTSFYVDGALVIANVATRSGDFIFNAFGTESQASSPFRGPFCGLRYYSATRTQEQIAADALIGGISPSVGGAVHRLLLGGPNLLLRRNYGNC